MADVLLKLHGVEGDKGAKVTAELFVARVTEPPVPQEHRFVGAAEIAVRAVVGEMGPMMSLHLCLAAEDCAAGAVTTLYCFDPVLL